MKGIIINLNTNPETTVFVKRICFNVTWTLQTIDACVWVFWIFKGTIIQARRCAMAKVSRTMSGMQRLWFKEWDPELLPLSFSYIVMRGSDMLINVLLVGVGIVVFHILVII